MKLRPEDAVRIAVGVKPFSSVEMLQIEQPDSLRCPLEIFFQLVIPSDDAVQNLFQQLLTVNVCTYDLFERHRIGGIGEELFLIHVQANPDDALVEVFPLYLVLYQDAGYFLVFPVDVVRPFDAEAGGMPLRK